MPCKAKNCRNTGGISNKLYKVNLAVGTLEYVAAFDAQGNTIFTLAIDGEGNAYGLSYADGNFGGATSKLYSIDLSTGSCTVIGDTGLGLRFVQSTVWDHNTDQLFLGTVLDPEDFPEPPIHEGYEFTGWTYYGAPVYADTIIKAKYRDPNAPMTTVILRIDNEWPDGSGYRMLIDADATAYGNEIPTYG